MAEAAPLSPFGPAVRAWFAETFAAPTAVQERGWEMIARGAHTLLIAPTGSGKTLAAFLWAIDSLRRLPPAAPPGARILYVSPLKALVYDIERNLQVPLAGLRRMEERLGTGSREIRVDVRTGDTPPRFRRLQARHPADILVTTPESLFLLLGSAARDTLRTVHTVIVDEVHALAPDKRGAHLALSLERLAQLAATDPQRIGLSATVRPAVEVARFLGGDRPVAIVDASAPPDLDLQVMATAPDMEHPAPQPGAQAGERGIWGTLFPALLAEIRAHRSTILFVNSRGLCERTARRLNELAGEELVQAHHGSVARERRLAIEEALKAGSLRGLVATSSLELGIDMGAVDLVLQVASPGSVARGLQRVGRAGHRVGETSVGRLYPKFRGDLLECAVVAGRMREGAIEALRVPKNPLDVLAQQAAAMVCERPRTPAEIGRLVRRASPFRDLSGEALEGTLAMLAGAWPGTEFADLRPLLAWDRAHDLLSPRRGAELVVRLNAGTIPDRGTYAVRLGPDGPKLGELDEEMVYETRTGDNILLGASTWHVEEITRDRVIVSPAPGQPGRLPFWHGEGPGRPVEVGRAIGAFVREIGALPPEGAVAALMERTPLDRSAAGNLAAYLAEQREATGTLPTDRRLTVERFRDELGDWKVCILSPFGSRVHAPWALALQRRLGETAGAEPQVMYTDEGIALRLAEAEELPALSLLFPDPEEIQDAVVAALADSPLFASLFRENAARALLLQRRRADRRRPLWAQRLKAQGLLATIRDDPTFPMLLETYRQALADVFDLPALREVLRGVRSREIRVDEVETPVPSPFARSLVFAWVSAFLYEGDAPLAERRAQALTLDRRLLAELLGGAEERQLLDPQAVAEVEAELQHRDPEWRAGYPDALHDLLRRLGDLTPAEAAERCTAEPGPWLASLQRQRRVAAVDIAGEGRWIAAEDAPLYGAALGLVPPPDLPDSFLPPPDKPLERLLRRFAHGRGPFSTAEAAGRFGLPADEVEPLLRTLEVEGILVRGELRPGGTDAEWCDAEVLRRLKRRTLARLRQEAAPVEGEAFARFLAEWQGLGGESRPTLEEALAQLEGLPLPWSVLAGVLLPERIPGFRPEDLDLLAAAGRLVWVGRGALGARDGRVVLYRREQAARLLPPPEAYEPPGALHAAVLAHLERRGASFLAELEGAVRAACPAATPLEFRAALWDLVWAGQLTNDTFAPLRALGRKTPSTLRGRHRAGASLAGGRWSLVAALRGAVAETERALARAEMLLERYGVVSREAAQAEEVSGGWGPLYPVLREMEETGRVRRGYFVAGLSGAQFARPGAVDRLRRARPEAGGPAEVRTLAALDPANPFGALLPWPEPGGPEATRPRRVPGAWVILAAGRPTFWLAPGGRQLTTFAQAAEGALSLTCDALHRLPRGGRRGLLTIEAVDGVPVEDSPHWLLLRRCGFERDYRGLVAAMHQGRSPEK